MKITLTPSTSEEGTHDLLVKGMSKEDGTDLRLACFVADPGSSESQHFLGSLWSVLRKVYVIGRDTCSKRVADKLNKKVCATCFKAFLHDEESNESQG